ncbi:hypothetical protein M9194_07810 [Vibrio sp. S4M6]|uniref:ABC transporter substrate-binding protein n=1 Tax=Vibrio sinus TaxID=2946865 RepID=UPI00202A4C9B|nr:ABC transporter substrate binding protein [Vibrio sinus]MCL9781330.1 hypothetical protein [Vibrio sinus]
MIKYTIMCALGLSITWASYANERNADEVAIGVAWVGQSNMSNRVLAGMTQRLNQIAPNVQIEERKELSSHTELAELVSQWNESKQGMVIMRSNGSKWLSNNPPVIPTFTGGHTHPRTLGVSNLPNITGVTYYLPKAFQFNLLKQLMPDMKSILLLLEEGHPSSAVDQTDTKWVTNKIALQYNEYVVSDISKLDGVIKVWKDKVDLIVLGNQALIADNAEHIVQLAGDTVVVSYHSEPIYKGALGGFVPDDYKLGAMLADSIKSVLIDGVDITSIPYKTDDTPTFLVNGEAMKRYQLVLPTNVKNRVKFIE